MFSSPSKAPSHAGPSCSSLPRSSSTEEVAASFDSDGEVEQDQLAFTIESPSTPHLQLFKNVFNMGKSLASYCWDDLLWPTLGLWPSPVPIVQSIRRPVRFPKVPLGVPFALVRRLAA
ncbi:hypothetical protein F5876DRAFT_83871 [Lentinula aff. lateritia]|uniref:Uncharacterized protein n=1 Tax=Lentinula aff. lateritia TaxID=2804960 RepID=A0ACC1TH96_9AGAR|nr:hypothetical protein F5876DRAFT_83871 [Lentinula aff. lateritia]